MNVGVLARHVGAGVAITVASALVLLSGCRRVPTDPGLSAPDVGSALSRPRCSARHSTDEPLVVEWPAAERAALEARAQRGLVVVRYEGCEMEVLSSCQLDGRYDFVALNPKHERVTIHNADELYARLPVGAAALEGKLERSGQLTVDMSIVGRQQADRHVVDHDELIGHCGGATHVLTGLTVGAFALHTGAATEFGASADIGPAGAGGSHERTYELLARDGEPAACQDTESLDPSAPPRRCSALLAVDAVPLVGQAPRHEAAPSPVEAERLAALDRRGERRAARWRAVSITSGVLSGASLGGLMGGAVLKLQDDMRAPWEEPTPEQARRDQIATGMLVGSSVGLIGFGALTVGAATAARRARRHRHAFVSPMMSPTIAGVQLRGRF